MAEALELADFPSLYKQIDRNKEEFKGKTGLVTVDTPSGKQRVRVINYHGVIRVSMLSEAPRRAKEFRDWAEDVLFNVMTTGHYEVPALREEFNLPVLQQILKGINETVLLQGRMLQNQEKQRGIR